MAGIYKHSTCQLCGNPVPKGRKVYCGPECSRLGRNECSRRYHWRKAHGEDATCPPRREVLTNCRICGRPLDQSFGSAVSYCSTFCRRVGQSEFVLRRYYANREHVLAQQSEYRRRKAEARKEGKR